jgi:hypothetical protein
MKCYQPKPTLVSQVRGAISHLEYYLISTLFCFLTLDPFASILQKYLYNSSYFPYNSEVYVKQLSGRILHSLILNKWLKPKRIRTKFSQNKEKVVSGQPSAL